VRDAEIELYSDDTRSTVLATLAVPPQRFDKQRDGCPNCRLACFWAPRENGVLD
jgi:cobalamin-dependent methionine synthase I